LRKLTHRGWFLQLSMEGVRESGGGKGAPKSSNGPENLPQKQANDTGSHPEKRERAQRQPRVAFEKATQSFGNISISAPQVSDDEFLPSPDGKRICQVPSPKKAGMQGTKHTFISLFPPPNAQYTRYSGLYKSTPFPSMDMDEARKAQYAEMVAAREAREAREERKKRSQRSIGTLASRNLMGAPASTAVAVSFPMPTIVLAPGLTPGTEDRSGLFGQIAEVNYRLGEVTKELKAHENQTRPIDRAINAKVIIPVPNVRSVDDAYLERISDLREETSVLRREREKLYVHLAETVSVCFPFASPSFDSLNHASPSSSIILF